jgi:two-component SAPR family response regulator
MDQGKSQRLNDNASVLIVDNDPKTIRIMLEILACRGIRANLVDNKKAAVDFLDENICDLVFISDKLSCLQSCFELICKIKSNSP